VSSEVASVGESTTPQSRGEPEAALAFSPPLIPEPGIAAVIDCLRSGWVGTGPVTTNFEIEFARYVKSRSAAAVSSCTSGLFLALTALGVGPGDEVITSSMTFCSTVNAILHTGARPVLVDVDRRAKNLSLDHVEQMISPRTRAVIPVHYSGYPVDMTRLLDLCQGRGIDVIEDCAHAAETTWAFRHAGTFGIMGAFSFYATKNLAIGEGGMVVSDDADLVRRVAQLALHGLSRDAWTRFSASGKRTYEVEELGYKANMTDVQAAIGLAQLAVLEQNYKRRQAIWRYYMDHLSSANLDLPAIPDEAGSRHALHLFTVGLPENIDRDDFVQSVGDVSGVALGIHYRSIPDFQFYRSKLGVSATDFPVATDWGRRCISLGVSPRLKDSDLERTVEAVLGRLSCV